MGFWNCFVIACLICSIRANLRIPLTKSVSKNPNKDIPESIENFATVGTSEDSFKSEIVTNISEFFKSNTRVNLKNFYDVQYYGPLYLGSQSQKLNFIFDTGSSWLWYPKQSCIGCPNENFFDYKSSDTYTESDYTLELFYGIGYVKGTIANDYVSLTNNTSQSVPLKALAVDYGIDLNGTIADGILGLAPTEALQSESFLLKLASEGIIDSPQFTVYISTKDEQSYIEFGSLQDQNKDLTWMPLTSEYYWSVEYNYIALGSKKLNLNAKTAILDTGTSMLAFPAYDFPEVIKSIAGYFPIFYFEEIGFYGSPCFSTYFFPDITVNIKGHETKISRDDYIIQTGGFCIFFMVGLEGIDSVILGDLYLHKNLVIFDAENMRIGLTVPKAQSSSSTSLLLSLLISSLFTLLGYWFYSKYLSKHQIQDDDMGYRLMTENEGA